MSILNVPKNAKYIGYKCIICEKNIEEDERQSIIALGAVHTWCLLCIEKRNPGDKLLSKYVSTHGANNDILDRNKLLNDL